MKKYLDKLKNYPIGISGTCLAFITLSNSWQIKGINYFKPIAITLAVCMLILMLIRLIRFPKVMFEELKNPDMQYVLYEGQKNYARYGSKELLDRLIFLLAERTENVEKDIIQLNLNEAIGIASKMTEKQNNLLTIAFILRRVEWPNVQNIEDLVYKIKTQVISFIPKDKEIRTDIEYLTYLGCGNSLLGDNLEDILKRRYPGIFKGIGDTKAYLLDKLPEIKELFELWNDKELCTYNITTVGLTIGWANFSNKLNINAGLDIWLK